MIGLAAAIPALPAVEDAARASATEALLNLVPTSQPAPVHAAILEALGAIQPCLAQPQGSGGLKTAQLGLHVKSILLSMLRQYVPEAEGLGTFVKDALQGEHEVAAAGSLNMLGDDPALIEATLAGQ